MTTAGNVKKISFDGGETYFLMKDETARTDIGDLTSLITDSKTSLVDAINEVQSNIPIVSSIFNSESTSPLNGIAVAAAIANKADSATSLSGYGITDAYTKTEIDGKLSAAMHYKGTVVSVTALSEISNPAIGDMYNVTDTGANYAYNGTDWDKLSENVDLSGVVPNTRTINEKALSGDITLSASDVSALPDTTFIPSNVSDLTNDTGFITGVAWNEISDKPETFTPSTHNQATNTINSLTGYTKATEAVALSESDSLNVALGKLEKAIETKQAGGSYVPTSTTVNGKALSNDITLSATDVEALPNDTFIPSNVSDLTNDTGFITSADIPESISAFTNDLGYLTEHQDLSEYAKLEDIPTEISVFNNDAGYLTEHQDLSEYALLTDIPESISAFTNDVGYLTEHQDVTAFAKLSELSDVATSGSYNDLTDKPTIPIITDTYTSTSTDGMSGKAVYNAIANKADKATTLSGYNISDAYTKTEIDGKLTGAMHYKGTVPTVTTLSEITSPAIGDMYNITDSGANYAYNGEDWDKLSENIDLSGVVPNNRTINNKALSSDITLSASDVGALSDSIIIPIVPSEVSAFTNDAGYLTEHQDITGKANLSELADVAISGSYNDLTDKPSIPTKTSDLTNDSEFLTEHQDISGKANLSELATVAISGSYNDLEDKPTIPTIPSNVSDFTNDIGYLVSTDLSEYALKSELPDITGKANLSELASVATSGSYNDLEDTPTIPTVPTDISAFNNDAGYLTDHQDITGKANLSELASVAISGSYNDLTNTPSIPTDTNDLTNGAGFITSADIPTKLSDLTDDLGTSPTHTHSQYLTDHQDISGKANLSEVYTKSEIDGKLSSAMHYKGTVANESALENVSNPNIGDVYNVTDTGANYAYNGSTWDKLSENIDLSGLVPNTRKINAKALTADIILSATDVGALPDSTSIPSKTSDLTNDSGFLTDHQDISGKADLSELSLVATSGSYNDLEDKPTIPVVPSEVSAFNNDSGYLVTTDLSEYALKSELPDITGKAELSELSDVAISGSYNDLIDIPTIPIVPSEVSAFTNDMGYLTEHQDITGKADLSELATVAISGDYTDLTNLPILPVVPSEVSAFTNDAGYITSSDISGKQDSDTAVTHTQNTAVGDEITPIYVNNLGVATALSYTIAKSVPSEAEFTDTTYSQGDGINITNGIISNTLTGAVSNNGGNINALISRLEILEQRVANLNKTNVEPVAVEDNVNLNDATADYVLSGDFTEGSVIVGKSAEIKDSEIEAAVVNVTVSEDVDLKGTDISGAYDKTTQGNAMINLHSDGYITIKDCTISATGYNALEIGLSTGEAKNILIDNVDFSGTFSNNAINIYGTADEAIITISNCHFGTVSNAVRLSNRTNCKCTLNIINCVFDAWEPTGAYAGPILCQDYTSTTAELAEENNLFAPEKIKINLQNITKPDGTKLLPPTNISDICGSGTNQMVYVYRDKSGVVAYDITKYPQITVS